MLRLVCFIKAHLYLLIGAVEQEDWYMVACLATHHAPCDLAAVGTRFAGWMIVAVVAAPLATRSEKSTFTAA